MKDLKKLNFSITDSTTFYGVDTVEFYSKALLGFNSSKYFTLVPNVKSKIKLPQFDMGSVLQSDNSTWNPTGEGTLSQKTFTVCPLKINLEYFKSTFEQDFLSEYLKSGSNTAEVTPQVFTTYIVDQTLAKAANDLEVLSWGATSRTTCDGLIYKLKSDNTVISGATTAATSTNILSILTAVYNQIPKAILNDKTNVKFFVASNVMRAYNLFQASTGAGQGFNYSDGQKMNFLGYEVVEAAGMLDNAVVAASVKNLLLLTDLLGDVEEESNIVIIPQLNVSGVPSLRIRMGFKFAVDFKIGAEIVALM